MLPILLAVSIVFVALYWIAMHIRVAHSNDFASVLEIIMPVIRRGETYALDRNLTEHEALSYWFAEDKTTFAAEVDGEIVGTYFFRRNHAGGGGHVCNCGYMVPDSASGRGIALSMCQHSLEWARAQGYRAMQFNFVVSTNERAVMLWKSIGFTIVGCLPQAFHHPDRGYVDAFVMHQNL